MAKCSCKTRTSHTMSYNYWPFQEAMRKVITRAVNITGTERQFEVMIEWSGTVAKAAFFSEVWVLESFQKELDNMAPVMSSVAVDLKEKEELVADQCE